MNRKTKFDYFSVNKRKKCKGFGTDKFYVRANDGWLLGEIRWHPHWRQYCYFPDRETVWSASCLEDLKSFLKEANMEHRWKLAKNEKKD